MNPEGILPTDALEAGASIVATGRSDFANQVNNAVVFPAILRSLLDLRVKTLSEEMLVSVGTAIAEIVDTNHLKYDYIITKVDDHVCLFDLAGAMRDSIKGSQLISIEKAGHGFYYEEKEKVNTELVGFID
jgi:malate dehydrogenase (oxaloacetate-decarboxylating)